MATPVYSQVLDLADCQLSSLCDDDKKMIRCGLYYKNITIVNDAYRVIRKTPQLGASPAIDLSVCLFVCLSICLSVCLSACLPVCLSACLPVCLSACLSVFLSVCVCLSVCLSFYMSICLSVCLSFSFSSQT
jgi:hypothetical protein